VRNGIEFGEFQFVVGPNVDESAFVLGRVTISGCRKHLEWLAVDSILNLSTNQ
jgi:hypothetical protein